MSDIITPLNESAQEPKYLRFEDITPFPFLNPRYDGRQELNGSNVNDGEATQEIDGATQGASSGYAVDQSQDISMEPSAEHSGEPSSDTSSESSSAKTSPESALQPSEEALKEQSGAPLRPTVRVQKVSFKKRGKSAAEKEADKRLAALRSDIVADLEKKMKGVAGDAPAPSVVLSFQAFIHFFEIWLPFLIFWHASEEELQKVTRKKRKTKARKKRKAGVNEAGVQMPRKRAKRKTATAKTSTTPRPKVSRPSTRVQKGTPVPAGVSHE